jgi:hypothetical protein
VAKDLLIAEGAEDEGRGRKTRQKNERRRDLLGAMRTRRAFGVTIKREIHAG